MKKNALSLFLLLFFCNIFCQNFTGCIEINFEDIPNQQPQEGLVINEQYLTSHGIRFELENGASPILAQVGGAITAFGSMYGNDEPEPGSNIGQFFLTDNGVLSGLQMVPVIVRFQMPIDSFSACVLDIDFDEFFIIQARGQNEEIILADTIISGDPGTGDGAATCWGFNFDGCEGSIYSIRFEGHRMQSGAFGLGMDNFSFCFSGVDIATQIVVETQDLNCEQASGSINILNLGQEIYLYSLDGISFQSDPFFDEIPIGIHTLFVADADGCIAEFQFQINDFEPLLITQSLAQPTTCGEGNGSIQIFASYTEGVFYSIDNTNFQVNPIFTQLVPGNYPLTIIDGNGCFHSDQVMIAPSTAPVIDHITTIDDHCNYDLGSVFVQGSGGTGELIFRLNDGQHNFSPALFDSLAMGDYIVQATDAVGCIVSEEINIEGGPVIIIENIKTIPPDCDEINGQISFQASGGTGQLIYQLNGLQTQFSSHYTQLAPDEYNITVTDSYGCMVSSSVNLPKPICPIYIPNVFSPDYDGTNDVFKIFTNRNYDVQVLKCQIFDRWGELVWEQGNFSMLNFRKWWNGSFRGEPAMQGVYVYVIEVEHHNGFREFFSGDVVLVR